MEYLDANLISSALEGDVSAPTRQLKAQKMLEEQDNFFGHFADELEINPRATGTSDFTDLETEDFVQKMLGTTDESMKDLASVAKTISGSKTELLNKCARSLQNEVERVYYRKGSSSGTITEAMQHLMERFKKYFSTVQLWQLETAVKALDYPLFLDIVAQIVPEEEMT